MTNLRNTNLRARDVNKLAGYKFFSLYWDQGCDSTSEWVIASLSEKKHRELLVNWLSSKDIEHASEVVVLTLVDSPIRRYTWQDILNDLEIIFNGVPCKIYEIDFKWHLEYAEQEIARFGRYKNA